MIDKLRNSPQPTLWHMAGNYADRPAALWPGGAEQGSPKGVNPAAEALVMITDREGEMSVGKLDEVQLLLQDREDPTLKMHVRIEAHINNIGGVVAATAGEFKANREIGQDAARQIYEHYLEKYGGNSIYLMSRKDMEDTAAMMLLEGGPS